MPFVIKHHAIKGQLMVLGRDVRIDSLSKSAPFDGPRSPLEPKAGANIVGEDFLCLGRLCKGGHSSHHQFIVTVCSRSLRFNALSLLDVSVIWRAVERLLS